MPKKTKDPYLFRKKIINGVPVYFNHLPWSPCTHISMGFKVGSLHDPKNKEGLSHFLEHTTFIGSPLFPNRKDFWDFSKKYALNSFNARTGSWFTEYTAKCLPNNLKTVLGGFYDFIFKCYIDPKETEKEKKIIIQEIWDNHVNKKKDKYIRYYLKTTRPGLLSSRMWTAAGWADTVEKITASDLRKFHTKNYHAGNMYVLLAGNIEESHIKEVERIIAKIPKGQPLGIEKPKNKVRKPLTNRKSFKSDDIGMKQDHATYHIEINTARDLKNESVPHLSEQLLYSIFFEELREKMNLCYAIYVGCDNKLDHYSNYIVLNLPPNKLGDAEKKIFEIIGDIKKGKYKKKFEEEKKLGIDQLISNERMADNIISNASWNIINYGKIGTLKERISDRKKVTHSEVSEYISKTFKKENVYIERILP